MPSVAGVHLLKPCLLIHSPPVGVYRLNVSGDNPAGRASGYCRDLLQATSLTSSTTPDPTKSTSCSIQSSSRSSKSITSPSSWDSSSCSGLFASLRPFLSCLRVKPTFILRSFSLSRLVLVIKRTPCPFPFGRVVSKTEHHLC